MHHFKKISLGNYEGFVQREYYSQIFLEQISDCNLLLGTPECSLLTDSRNKIGAIKLRINNNEYQDVVIKKFTFSWLNRIKSIIFPSKTLKSWESANKLLSLKISTPFPIAILEKKERGLIKEGFFITERLSDVQEIRYLFMDSDYSQMRKLIPSLSDFLNYCHNKGVLHSDLSDGNILVSPKNEGFSFYLVDVNRIRFKKKIGPLKRIRNLVRLGIPPTYQKFFLMKYLEKEKLSWFIWIWYKINKTMFWQKIQIKKKLKLRKIARFLKIQ